MSNNSQQVKQCRIKQQKNSNQIESKNLITIFNDFSANKNIDSLVKNFSKKISSILEGSQIQQKRFQIQKNFLTKPKQFAQLPQIQNQDSINNQNKDYNNHKKQLLNTSSQIFSNSTKIKAPQRLNILDLETSFKKQNLKKELNNQFGNELQNSPKIKDFDQKSSLKSSRIVTKLNQMQEFYTNKIRQLTIKNSYLQNQKTQLQSKNKNLIQSIAIFKQIAQRKKSDIDSQMQSRINQIKEHLIQRFSLQARDSYKTYVEQIKKINQSLIEQKKRRAYFQNQCKVLTIQKQNIQSMYKQILQNHKDLIRLQINQTSSELSNSSLYHSQLNEGSISQKIQRKQVIKNQQINMSDPQIIYNSKKIQKNDFSNQKRSNNQRKNKLSKDSKSTIKKNKKKSLKHQKQQAKSQFCPKLQMSRQELIPFLASGIQQLKQKLKLQ